MEKISVFGLGRVGLVMAVCYAKHGYKVVGIDPDSRIVGLVGRGKSPFFEPGLQEYLTSVVRRRRFSATQDPSANSQSDIAYISVGTPSQANGEVDLSFVEQAAMMIGKSLRNTARNQLVVIKSTVTPGTARNLVRPTIEREAGKDAGIHFSICSNPEFLREGNAIRDTEFPDRIIVGSDDPLTAKRLLKFYKGFHRGDLPPVVRTSFENAELTKYANNAFLATKVSFINCIANIAGRIPHADVAAVADGIGLDRRIGRKFLNAGLGWGGSCFPKDLKSLLRHSMRLGYDGELIAAAVETNTKQPRRAVELAKNALGSLRGKHVAILGLAFKPDTDDMRDAVSVQVINALLNEQATVTVWDPQAMKNAHGIFGDKIRYAREAVQCIEKADCCILTTEWPQFKKLRPRTFLKKMRTPILIDGRRLYDTNAFKGAGVKFLAIGLGPDD